MAKYLTEAEQQKLNLLAFQGRVVRNKNGQIRVAFPKLYFEATGAHGEPTSVRIVHLNAPEHTSRRAFVKCRAAFRYSGMERNRTSDRW